VSINRDKSLDRLCRRIVGEGGSSQTKPVLVSFVIRSQAPTSETSRVGAERGDGLGTLTALPPHTCADHASWHLCRPVPSHLLRAKVRDDHHLNVGCWIQDLMKVYVSNFVTVANL